MDDHQSAAGFDIKVLACDELSRAVALLAEGMRDNPVHMQAFGADPQRRQRRLRRFLGHAVGYVGSNGMLLGAYAHGELVGALGMLEPGHCRPGRMQTLAFACFIIGGNTPACAWRIRHWLAAWARNDLREPHWHLGPLAVLPAWRRQGAGRCLMLQCCRRLDALGATAWLETDREINVAFYETFGFTVTRHEPVLGATNWFMRRPPR